MLRARLRFLLSGLVLLACLSALVWVLVGRFLSSQRLAPLIATRLQALLGSPVQVDQVNPGLQSSSIENIRLFEAGTTQAGEPWALLQKVQADLPALGILFGRTSPRDLTLEGAFCTLRLDKMGRLQTRLPRLAPSTAPFPTVHLRQGELVLLQDEHPEFALTGVSGQISTEGSQLVAEGLVTDPSWGSWTFHGCWDRQSERGSLTLQAPTMHVTQSMLERLPFVAARVWQQVQCEGDTPVEIELGFEVGAPKPHYCITLRPQETRVHISSIDLFAEHARGQLSVEDGVVRLNEVQGQAADGLLKTEANLNFRARPAELQFDILAEQLNLRRLPQKWALPRSAVQGRVDGRAHLLVTVLDGKARTCGDGNGTISGARIAGLTLKRPIPVRLYSDGKGVHFAPGRILP